MKPGYASSGNIFFDLGFKDSEQELLKAKLILQIHRLLKEQGLTQQQAAERLGTRRSHILALMRLKPVSVSVVACWNF